MKVRYLGSIPLIFISVYVCVAVFVSIYVHTHTYICTCVCLDAHGVILYFKMPLYANTWRLGEGIGGPCVWSYKQLWATGCEYRELGSSSYHRAISPTYIVFLSSVYGGCPCHGNHVKGRGQLAAVISFLPFGPRIKFRSSRFAAKYLYPLSDLGSPALALLIILRLQRILGKLVAGFSQRQDEIVSGLCAAYT